MKSIYFILLVVLFASCGQSNHENSAESTENPENNVAKVAENTPAEDYSEVEKFLGQWCAEDQPSEVITISKANDFDKTHTCIINDGRTDFSFPYNNKEDKFRAHQPDYWVEVLHDNATKQLLWKVIHFDETDGKVVRKYIAKQ